MWRLAGRLEWLAGKCSLAGRREDRDKCESCMACLRLLNHSSNSFLLLQTLKGHLKLSTASMLIKESCKWLSSHFMWRGIHFNQHENQLLESKYSCAFCLDSLGLVSSLQSSATWVDWNAQGCPDVSRNCGHATWAKARVARYQSETWCKRHYLVVLFFLFSLKQPEYSEDRKSATSF